MELGGLRRRVLVVGVVCAAAGLLACEGAAGELLIESGGGTGSGGGTTGSGGGVAIGGGTGHTGGGSGITGGGTGSTGGGSGITGGGTGHSGGGTGSTGGGTGSTGGGTGSTGGGTGSTGGGTGSTGGGTGSTGGGTGHTGGGTGTTGGGTGTTGGGTGTTGGGTGTGGGNPSARGVFGVPAMAAFDALSAAQRTTLSSTKVLFHHHSVGENLMGFWTDDDAAGGAASLGFPFTSAGSPGSYATVRLGEASGGNNQDAQSKLTSLQAMLVNQGYGAAVQVAVFKFCYVDFGGGSTVGSMAQAQALETSYRSTVAAIQAASPSLRLVHITPPLNTYWNSDGNELRAELGRFLRDEYGATGFVVDLQDVESHELNGTACARSGVPVACDSYVGGTGHLTGLGATRGAKALLYTILQAATAP